MGPGSYEASCPVDKGSSKRLRVVEAEDGRAHVECDDGCWLSEIIPALGLTADDLFKCIDDIYIGTEAPRFEPPEGLRADRLLDEDPPATGDCGGAI